MVQRRTLSDTMSGTGAIRPVPNYPIPPLPDSLTSQIEKTEVLEYRELLPAAPLEPFVKCYYIYISDSDIPFTDTVFPSGCTELIFNLGPGQWQVDPGRGFRTNPSVELWGQITQPLPVRSVGQNTMLGVRFFPHGAACLVRDKMDLFNNQVLDFADISGKSAQVLHECLLETPLWETRVKVLEGFLLDRFRMAGRHLGKIGVINDVMQEFHSPRFFDNIDNVASRCGISARYLQKLFVQYTGLTPKLYNQVNRFQNSLRLIARKEATLTSIAYDCGYFDQSHFIREFKSFTGFTPSRYASRTSPITRASVES